MTIGEAPLEEGAMRIIFVREAHKLILNVEFRHHKNNNTDVIINAITIKKLDVPEFGAVDTIAALGAEKIDPHATRLVQMINAACELIGEHGEDEEEVVE